MIVPMTEILFTVATAFMFWKLNAGIHSMRGEFNADLARYEQVKAALPFETAPTVVKI
jgi:hypothetical protein